MITTIPDYDDATAFERLALTYVPLGSTQSSPDLIDLELRSDGTAHFTRGFTEDLGAAAVTEVLGRFRPLLFGAAWKVLDLLVELALSQSNYPTPKNGRVTIDAKIKAVSSGWPAPGLGGTRRSCRPPASLDPQPWKVLAATYAKTHQVRHALVHRRVDVDHAGHLIGTNDQGTPLTPVSSQAQEALCRAAQRAATTVINRGMTVREGSDLAAQLDQLAALHGEPLLGGVAAGHVERVRVHAVSTADGRWQLDLPSWQQGIAAKTSDPWVDLEIQGPQGGRGMLAHLEDIPAGVGFIDPNAPPGWVQTP